MINRIYLKDCLSFKEIDLEFNKGLNVFTGPSGAGKSILMQAILSLFAQSDVRANLGEVLLSDSKIIDELYDLDLNDDIIIKTIKKEKVRFFINNQTISKKNLNTFSSKLIKHLNLRDTSDFESFKLLNFLDKLSSINDRKFIEIKSNFDLVYKELVVLKKELEKIKNDELKIEDLKEFAKFEIEKIEAINPTLDEYEELNLLKRKLSKKDKIEDAIKDASEILNYRHSVSNTLELLEEDSSFFDETMNELNNIFEKFNDSLFELEDIDIETVLTRIEKLASLQKRFGSIESALEYKEEKKKELLSYDNITFEKSVLEKKIDKLTNEVNKLSLEISVYRKNSVVILEDKINEYLKFLYLSNAKITIQEKNLDSFGIDEVYFELNGVSLNTISSGEYNRLRLALLTSMSEFDIIENGVLFLDEIDANLSGKESDAIANVLSTLSNSYQIFAISHQPQLTSVSSQHFLVDKKDGISTIKLLSKDERINEIARMISGEKITKNAIEFAKNLLIKK
ncbi:AAA family ATPase [Poseidonibacter ostreae]|jgi:DNA repair protein RecN (Recombination protein N)|uniref:DNA repair protein RecN n=1 Tax=Poseidonibacter ostreae TaxID=2654171 RepID=A0A6L4WSH6_9BACT|nr:AAA family ATPase [Poseidonibacter ostreae]KAB7886275.1 AAA family ATPase [Poseidonibacter ostreae]KAB7888894.1 AAA family ATPase [Poseidonibacter ostreae]KAB7890061.1 AAA family ATPase [Poseidonibacter ostreae]